jgi:tight adherence protein B
MSDAIRLLAVASVCLIGLGVSATLLVRDGRRTRERTLCIEKSVGLHRVSQTGSMSEEYRLDRQHRRRTLLDRAAKLALYDPAHQGIYPARPAVVVTVASVIAVIAAKALVDLLGPSGWLTSPALLLLICRRFYGWYRERHAAALFRQFPDALAMIVRTARVGLPVVEALRVVARETMEPTRGEFAALVAQTSIGVPLDDALREMSERNRLPEYRFFATALALQSQTGGSLAEALENLADTIRKRLAARMRGRALAAEARMSAYILGGLPIVTGIMLELVDPDYMQVLFTDPAGRKLLWAGAGLLCLGGFTMRLLIRKSLT